MKGSKGREGPERGLGEMGGERRIRSGRRQGRSTESQKIEWRCVALQGVELAVATRKSQMPRKEEFPRTQL